MRIGIVAKSGRCLACGRPSHGKTMCHTCYGKLKACEAERVPHNETVSYVYGSEEGNA